MDTKHKIAFGVLAVISILLFLHSWGAQTMLMENEMLFLDIAKGKTVTVTANPATDSGTRSFMLCTESICLETLKELPTIPPNGRYEFQMTRAIPRKTLEEEKGIPAEDIFN